MSTEIQYTLSLKVVGFLRAFLAAALLACFLTQALILPVVSGWVAEGFPEMAHMRWPILALSIVMLICAEVALVCTWKLLDAVRRDQIFDEKALPWVNRIIWTCMAAGSLVMITLIYVVTDGKVGPVTVHLLILMAAVGCFALAAFILVMRSLLLQAAQLRSAMNEVI